MSAHNWLLKEWRRQEKQTKIAGPWTQSHRRSNYVRRLANGSQICLVWKFVTTSGDWHWQIEPPGEEEGTRKGPFNTLEDAQDDADMNLVYMGYRLLENLEWEATDNTITRAERLKQRGVP